MILGQNETNLGTKQGDFLGREELILGHNKTIFRTKLGEFFGQEKLILGQNKRNNGIKKVTFWSKRS
jgi:hypothetical protein